MIKGRGHAKDGRPLAVLGLSHENVARLFANEPILVDLAADPPDGVGIPGAGYVCIIAGATEEAMAAELRRSGVAPEAT